MAQSLCGPPVAVLRAVSRPVPHLQLSSALGAVVLQIASGRHTGDAGAGRHLGSGEIRTSFAKSLRDQVGRC